MNLSDTTDIEQNNGSPKQHIEIHEKMFVTLQIVRANGYMRAILYQSNFILLFMHSYISKAGILISKIQKLDGSK